ncbi:MAG TPA: SAM-dependent chlorinase/fluorinase [Stellaceae bacterium]|nr:SAM-dependent chlorinase/fluorinase [Stellaceae bacterium]
MIVLFTDFGVAGPYTGQVKAVLDQRAPGETVIDLFADAPMRDPRAASYLLAAYADWFPAGTVLLAVVDPGVGGARAPLAARIDGRWFVGPDNGLFEIALRRAAKSEIWEIMWRPESLSASFHGRDLFAPVAAMLARGEWPQWTPRPAASVRRPQWPDDLPEIIYLDHYGNAMTGLRARLLPPHARLGAAGRVFARADTFSAVAAGEALWYENSNGLAEIAVNLGSAAQTLGLAIGSGVTVEA